LQTFAERLDVQLVDALGHLVAVTSLPVPILPKVASSFRRRNEVRARCVGLPVPDCY